MLITSCMVVEIIFILWSITQIVQKLYLQIIPGTKLELGNFTMSLVCGYSIWGSWTIETHITTCKSIVLSKCVMFCRNKGPQVRNGGYYNFPFFTRTQLGFWYLLITWAACQGSNFFPKMKIPHFLPSRYSCNKHWLSNFF